MFDLFSKINPWVFLVSLLVGLVYCYFTKPEPRIIIKHPSPNNVDKITYKDEDDNCFRYASEEIECPTADMVVQHPLNIK